MRLSIKYNNNQSILTKFISILSILCLYYLFYRYPFQINSETTSLNYKDTPKSLQMLKYLIYFLILFIFSIYSVLRIKRLKIYKKKMLSLVLSIMLFIIPLFYGIISKDFNALQIGMFFPIGIFVLFFNLDKINIKKISNIIYFFSKICVLAEIIQLILFFTIGRLPALAWSTNLLSARFGSMWDDPNGFAIFISFLIPFLVVRERGIKRGIWIFAMLAMLVLTQSLTGIIAFLISYILGTIGLFVKFRTKSKFKLLMLMIFSIVVLAFIFKLFIIPSNLFQQYIISKQGSIGGHANAITQLIHADVLAYSGLNPYGKYGESGYINLLLNCGILYLILYVFVGLFSVYWLLNKIKSYKYQSGIEVYYGALFFQITYLFAMFNLPLEAVFPVNALYTIFFVFSFSKPEPNIIENNNKKIKRRKIRIVWGK